MPRCSGFRASISGPSVQIKKIMLIIPKNRLLWSNSKKCKCVIGHISSKFKLNSKINWHNNIYTCHHKIIQKNHSKCVIVKLYSKPSLKNNKLFYLAQINEQIDKSCSFPLILKILKILHNNIYTCPREIIQKNYSKCVIVKLSSKPSLKSNKSILLCSN